MDEKKKQESNSNSIGQYFTPDYIARFMVNEVVETLKTNSKLDEIHNLHVLEPSVGEGIFLKYLKEMGFSKITAYEMDSSLKEILKKRYPNIEIKFKNFFSLKPQEKFDIVIGNPPYLGQNYNAEVFQEYCKRYRICAKYFVGNMDLFYYFIHLGIKHLKPGGILCFITTNYWITKSQKTGIKFLKPHILNDTYFIKYIDLSLLNIFKEARGQHNCIFILQKKTEDEKLKKINMPIQVVQITEKNHSNISEEKFNRSILSDITNNIPNTSYSSYVSATTNNDLEVDKNWNLLFPQKIKEIVDYIEEFCSVDNKIVYLKDIFLIRNGIIFPKDEIFILREDENIFFKGEDLYIKYNDRIQKILEIEKNAIKKIFKSRSIHPYSYDQTEFIGYGIFLNKIEFTAQTSKERNQFFNEKYPNLTNYLKQYEQILRDILLNANENPADLYFPRRGALMRVHGSELIDLEPYYSAHPKIFIRYITNENIFGFSNSTYYATSDTYFLWPKIDASRIDYPFILAYLNSKIVSFLFKAKNISIKRSKTKLEDGIPIPNLNYFRSENDLITLSLIKYLARRLMDLNPGEFDASFYRLNTINYSKDIIDEIIETLKNGHYDRMINIIDLLFFELFELNKQFIEDLLKKYY